MYRIFLVEDDQSIAGAVAKHLDSWGWEVHRVMDFQRVLEEFQAFGPHLTAPYKNRRSLSFIAYLSVSNLINFISKSQPRQRPNTPPAPLYAP